MNKALFTIKHCPFQNIRNVDSFYIKCIHIDLIQKVACVPCFACECELGSDAFERIQWESLPCPKAEKPNRPRSWGELARTCKDKQDTKDHQGPHYDTLHLLQFIHGFKSKNGFKKKRYKHLW